MAYSGREVLKALKAGFEYSYMRLGWGATLGGLLLALVVALVTKSTDVGLGLAAGPFALLPFVIFHHGRIALRHLKIRQG